MAWCNNDYPGKLIVGEGIDGAGKTTQLDILETRLKGTGWPVVRTDWNSSKLTREAVTTAKTNRDLTPETFSLLMATDFADRYKKIIVPSLKKGYIVIADRYVWTALVRDQARGLKKDWIFSLYDSNHILMPNLVLYFDVSPKIATARKKAENIVPNYYESGQDVLESQFNGYVDPYKCFEMFQERVHKYYREYFNESDTISKKVNTENGNVVTIHEEVMNYVIDLLYPSRVNK